MMSSLNPCLRGRRQLLVAPTTPATTCLTAEGWAQHMALIDDRQLHSTDCCLHIFPASFHLSGEIWIHTWEKKCFNHGTIHKISKKILSRVSVLLWWLALWFSSSNAVQQIRRQSNGSKALDAFVQNQRTWRWAVCSVITNMITDCTILVSLPKKTRIRI